METTINILICDDDPVAGDLLYESLIDKEGFSVQLVDNPTKALEIIQEYPIDIVLSDLSMPEMDGIELLKRVKAIKNDIDFIIITGFGTIKNAVTAMKNGAIDFLLKPIDLTELDIILEKVVGYRKLVEENLQLKAKLNQHFHIENILIGVSSIINNMRSMIYKISTVDSPILIYGESGTGKEVVARCIHFNSERRKNNFVPVFCSAIPVNLFEAELFGYKKGSFTGAIRDKKGLLEYADHGTLFFDEVSEITLDMQVKLLRFLQEQEILPIGSNERIKVDVKIIAATNKDLKKLVAEGIFREDLYFRLNVLPVNIPPLRERKEDIPILIQHFLKSTINLE